jgi:hypothetical protein
MPIIDPCYQKRKFFGGFRDWTVCRRLRPELRLKFLAQRGLPVLCCLSSCRCRLSQFCSLVSDAVGMCLSLPDMFTLEKHEKPELRAGKGRGYDLSTTSCL